MCSMRVQHEEQKHSAGGRGTGRMQSQRAPSLHPLPAHSTAGPGQGPLRPMSGVNPTLLIRQSRKVQSCKDRDGGKHRGGRLLETATAEVKRGWVSRGSAYQAEGTAPSVMLL